MPRVVFVGAGEIGAALAAVIGDRAAISLWDKDASRVPDMRPLEETVPEADAVFVCVPSFAVREVATTIRPLLRSDAVVVVLSKGIEAVTLKTMDAVLAETLADSHPFGLLGGPLLAEEIVAGLPGAGVFASASPEAFARVAPLFAGSNVRLESSDDPRSVALSAVLKNVYAVGLGVADGLNWGWNGKGWLAGISLQEMKRIAAELGGKASTIEATAGAGDFLATAMSPDSRNRTAGREIAQRGTCTIESEGCRSLPFILSLLGERASEYFFLSALDRIVVLHEDPKTVFKQLLAEHPAA